MLHEIFFQNVIFINRIFDIKYKKININHLLLLYFV